MNSIVFIVDAIFHFICENSDLLSTGTTFNINHEKMANSMDSEIFDEAGSDYDDDFDGDDDYEGKISPWKKKFDELKPLMEPLINDVSGWIYKRTITEGKGDVMGDCNCRIQWSYSMFLEGQEDAFDSTPNNRVERTDITLEGHHMALGSMRQGEEAQFLISYKFMYRDLGCPPRIPMKADILLVAKLISFVDTGDAQACDDVAPQDRRKFNVLRDKVDLLHKKALDDMRTKRYGPAIGVYRKAIQNLELCTLANEDEQNQQQKMLFDYYTNIAECYLHSSNWKKVCSMVNELRRRNAAYVNKDVNILLNEAIAVSHIEDKFDRAIGMMKKAQLLDPCNERVNRELNNLMAKKEKYDSEYNAMCQKMFGVMAKADNQK